MGGYEGKDGVPARAEVDMKAPFKSVKEAVMLFGEHVLAGQVFAAGKLNLIRAAASKGDCNLIRIITAARELERARQDLERAREEGLEMTTFLLSLREELDSIQTEVRQVREREPPQVSFDDVIEIETSPLPVNPTGSRNKNTRRRREPWRNCMTFARATTQEARVVDVQERVAGEGGDISGGRKKKPFIPLIGSLLAKRGDARR